MFRELREEVGLQVLDDQGIAGDMGCGVGLADEYPSIKHVDKLEKSGYEGTIEENMTLCVESYIGSERSGEGIKLEEQVLITAEGARILTSYPMETDWL